MSRLTWWRVLVVAGVFTGVGWIVGMLLDRSGSSPVAIPWTVAPVLLAVGAMVLALGRRVRQYRAGKKPDLDPIQAARTAMLAQAAAYSGAMLAGGYLGYGLAFVEYWSHEPRRELIVGALIAAAAAAALCAAGWIAERWCDASGHGDDPPGSSASAA